MGFSQCLVFLFFVLTNFQLHAYARNRGDNTPFFVFGDSLVDNGNNNFLATTARADSAPYGIDYPGHRATGRFSNGLNIPDIISEHFGWESPLPYLSPDLKGEKLLVGANFASAGVGVLNDTGVQFINIIKVFQQLNFFRQYQQRLSALIGREKAARHVKSSLVLITLGGNDFVNNYYLVPYSMRSQQFTLEAYVPFVIFEYKKILKKLYGLGVRRVIVTGNGPLGCVPAELALRSIDGECSDELQKAAALWNPQLVTMLNELNSEIGYNVFLAANTHQMHNDFLTNPRQFGFKTSKVACCGQGPFNGLGLCTASSNLCKNRDEYVFWDAFHPSEKANRLIAQQILMGSLDYMHPMNLTAFVARNEFRD